MSRLLFLFVILAVVVKLPVTVSAQPVREHDIGNRAFAFHSSEQKKVTSSVGSSDAIAVVTRITRLVGVPMNFDVRAAPAVANAMALVERVEGRERRVILYNPQWMDKLTATIGRAWFETAVLAHEIGHHLSGHLDPAYDNHPAELEADYFAGFILHKLGAALSEAQLAFAMVGPEVDTTSHPGRDKRVVEVARGWNASEASVGVNVIKASAPVPPRPQSDGASRPPERRVALLIGNSNYKSWINPLKNPKNDVIAVQRELRRVGFSTTTLYDGTMQQIEESVRLFREDAADADWALFYYAGTGIEVDGVQYMIPIDAEHAKHKTFAHEFPQMRVESAYEAVRAAKVLRMVVSDACRVDPENLPDAHGNLARPLQTRVHEPPSGLVLVQSTAAGHYAADGEGDLSPFAHALIKALREPHMEFDKVFRRASAEVATATKGRQVPIVRGNWPAHDLHLERR